MKRVSLAAAVCMIVVGLLLANFFGPGPASGQKLKYGTSTKRTLRHVLPIFAAQEHGLWEKQGLKVEWVGVSQSKRFYQAIAASSLNIGMGGIPSSMGAQARGLPIILVADLGVPDRYSIWVKTDSPIRKPEQLKGTNLGITRYGGSIHAFAVLALKNLGLEKDMKLVATGSSRAHIAALLAGTVDSIVKSLGSMSPLLYEGRVREVLAVSDFLPKKWGWLGVVARRDFAKAQPNTVRKAVKAVVEAGRFINNNPRWTIEKMKSFGRLSEKGATAYYERIKHYSKDGRIDPEGIENVRNFLIEYKLVRKGTIPPTRDMYTNEFIR